MDMYDIVADKPEVLEKCKKLGITPLIIGTDVELVTTPVKTSTALLTIATTSDREVLQSNIDAVTSIEEHKKQDFMHHRNSGLDQVTATILAKRANAYILNLRTFLHAQDQPEVLGRIQQNLKIAKKFSIPVLLASFAQTPKELPTPHDHQAFWRAMGADTKIVASNQQTYEVFLQRSKQRASPTYVAEGVTTN